MTMTRILLTAVCLAALGGCSAAPRATNPSAGGGQGVGPLTAPLASYATKETPAAADRILITDSEDANRTKNVTVGGLFGAPAPIGETTPNTGAFTSLSADSLDIVPPIGETGEMAVHEAPESAGDDWVGFKAPVDVSPGSEGDVLWTLPAADGTADQAMTTDGLGTLSWAGPFLLSTAIGSTVQGYDADLADLADGSLSGAKVGSGISATNIIVGTLPDARLSAAVPKWGTAPTTAADACTAGAVAYDSSWLYVCVATNTWVRVAVATW